MSRWPASARRRAPSGARCSVLDFLQTVLGLAGCGGPQSALAPAGRDAERVAELFGWMAEHTRASAGGPSQLTDQHLGGAIMLLVGGLSYLAGGLWPTSGLLRTAPEQEGSR